MNRPVKENLNVFVGSSVALPLGGVALLLTRATLPLVQAQIISQIKIYPRNFRSSKLLIFMGRVEPIAPLEPKKLSLCAIWDRVGMKTLCEVKKGRFKELFTP